MFPPLPWGGRKEGRKEGRNASSYLPKGRRPSRRLSAAACCCRGAVGSLLFYLQLTRFVDRLAAVQRRALVLFFPSAVITYLKLSDGSSFSLRGACTKNPGATAAGCTKKSLLLVSELGRGGLPSFQESPFFPRKENENPGLPRSHSGLSRELRYDP